MLLQSEPQNATHFGMQDGHGGVGECWVGTNPKFDQLGPADNCLSKDSEGHILGGAWSNAVYKMDV